MHTLYVRVWTAAADAVSDAFSARDADDLLRSALEGAARTRALIEDVQTAAWHLSGLPSRKDVRRLLHRTKELGDKLQRLDRRLVELERSWKVIRPSSGGGAP